MMYGHLHILRKLLQGQSLARICMNINLSQESIEGLVVDVGGGRNPDYFTYLQKGKNVRIESVDLSQSGINFEHDPLPYQDNSVDTVLLCNILEHLYNYEFLLSEVKRILRDNGKIIGFVPFWVGYHPDPHDYFRYTPEALERMFADIGLRVRVRSVGGGPLTANFNTISLSLPRILLPFFYSIYTLLDRVFICVRPRSVERNPLGFIFTATAPHA